MTARKFLALWEQMCEMAAPARRVLAGSVALRLGGVENGFEASPQSGSGFRLFQPQRLQNCENGFCIDFVDWPRPQGGGAFGKCQAPLLAMLGVAPFRRFCFEQRVGNLAECNIRSPMSCLYGIVASPQDDPGFVSRRASLGKADAIGDRTKTHLRPSALP